MKEDNTKKISISEYLEDNSLLEVIYIPFDSKLQIVSHVLNGMLKAIGGLNTSLLRKISTEVFIESITNIDMNIEDENGLKGFDQLCFHNELNNLTTLLGSEYIQLTQILNERVADYVRTETNPAVTINAIYDQVMERLTAALDLASGYIQKIDVEQLTKAIGTITSQIGDKTNEGE